MATKQALREFQNRLNERLQSARSTGVSASWLAVEAGASKLLLPLSHAGEIFTSTQVRPVHYAHSWFLGVANLRGGLLGVVELATFIAEQRAAASGQAWGDAPAVGVKDVVRGENMQAQSRLVALNPVLEVNCALLVDRLLGLRTTDAFITSGLPAQGAPSYFGHTYTDSEGVEWQEINLQTLSQDPAFLGIGA
ncbi:chemotaxis protein CheW [Ottowia thiooxydans]|uniref:chemotaxis protein CheW n=1 Tax=Ottowia thiooxydans TaxID=219182 RepID=UPI0003FD41E6|nr:chemotaxis protein CheW [Ottowia thiooxydans]